jgi:phage host-nuclease inhibitor protein Gam
MNRDEYVEKLKAQIDHWNGEATKLEARAKQAKAGVKAEYAAQLKQFRKRRDDAIKEMRRIQAASMDAWSELMRTGDTMLKNMQDAFEKARGSFSADTRAKPTAARRRRPR